MNDSVIQMEHIRKTYDGKKYVLDDLSFEAKKGELVVIKGLSGSGKSTLLNIMGLLDIYNSGTYTLNGFAIDSRKYNKYASLRAQTIGFIFQAYHLIDSISVRDNILLPFLYSDDAIDSDRIDRMNSILDNFNLRDLIDKKVALLSGGEKQRVAIARAVIKSPDVIIADEPTGNLDDDNTAIVINYLKALSKEGTTVLLVTHDMNLLRHSDRYYSLEQGRLK